MKIELELLGHVNIYVALPLQIFTAVLVGGIVGFERELKMKSAGVKTNMLICMGAMMYTVISVLNQKAFGGLSDPNRSAAQVISGIGFLGAGAIIQARGQVIGLTTAATIWLVAALGVAIGSGYPVTSFAFAVTTIVVLRVLDPLYSLFRKRTKFYLDILSYGSVKGRADSILNATKEDIISYKEKLFDEDANLYLLNIKIETDPKRLTGLLGEFRNINTVKRVTHALLRPHSNLLDDYDETVKFDPGDDNNEEGA